MPGRRDFLKLFGVSTAAVATVSGNVERVEDDPNVRRPAPAEAVDACFRTNLHDEYNVHSHLLYASVTIEKNQMAASYSPFVFNVPPARPEDSNMYVAGRLPAPQIMKVDEIGVIFPPTEVKAQLVDAFCSHYGLSFVLANKVYWEHPLAAVAAVGTPGPNVKMAHMDVPIIIPSECYFSLEIRGTPIYPCGKLKFWAALRGQLARPIQ